MNFLFIWRFNCRLLVSFCYRCLFLLFTCVSVSWSWHDLWPDGPWDVEGNVRLLFGGNLFFFLFFWWLFHVFRRDVKGSCQTPSLNVCLYLWGKKLVTIQTSCCKKKNPTDLLTSSRILSTLWWLHSVCAVLSSSLSLPQTGIFARFLLWSLRGAPSRGLWRHLC